MNTLRRLERVRQIGLLEAAAAHQDLPQLEIELSPFAPFSDRICELRHRVTILSRASREVVGRFGSWETGG